MRAHLAVMASPTRACGLPADFSGPMAKPHRMALVTAAALLAIPLSWVADALWWQRAALWLLVLGTAATVLRRAVTIVSALRRA